MPRFSRKDFVYVYQTNAKSQQRVESSLMGILVNYVGKMVSADRKDGKNMN